MSLDDIRRMAAMREKRYRAALKSIAQGNYSDFAGDPMQWASTIAYRALGGTVVNGQRVDDVDNL